MIAYLAFKLIKYLKDSLMISTFCFDLHNAGGKKKEAGKISNLIS
jgi:hypothetical protein